MGVYDYPPLLDGGEVTASWLAFWNPDGTWDVENRGVTPDIEAKLYPAAWPKGRDPQLEKAVEVALELLEKNLLPTHKGPEYPRYHAGQ